MSRPGSSSSTTQTWILTFVILLNGFDGGGLARQGNIQHVSAFTWTKPDPISGANRHA